MKILYLFLTAITLCIAGCSSDDSKNPAKNSNITFTINGEQKVLNKVSIAPSKVFQNGNEDYLSAFAVNESENLAIRLTFPKNKDHAPQGVGSIEYMEGAIELYGWQVDIDYTENSDNIVTGTFSGTFNNAMNSPDEQTRTVTDGTFEIFR